MSGLDEDDDDEVDLSDGAVVRRGTPAIRSSKPSERASSGQTARHTGPHKLFDMEWVYGIHARILERVRREGIAACKWSVVLEEWKDNLREAPFEEVEFGCVRTILSLARLTPNPQPTFYEALRKLGKDVLHLETPGDGRVTTRDLLKILMTPEEGCSDDQLLYPQYFGDPQSWELDGNFLTHLGKLHGLGLQGLSQELNKEKTVGFIVPHIRSARYHRVEVRLSNS